MEGILNLILVKDKEEFDKDYKEVYQNINNKLENYNKKITRYANKIYTELEKAYSIKKEHPYYYNIRNGLSHIIENFVGDFVVKEGYGKKLGLVAKSRKIAMKSYKLYQN